MGLNSCYVILKYIVILINLKFWIAGLALLALSIWLLTDPSAYISVTQDEASFKSGIYVLLVIGILILIVGILGCCGACYENQCLLISFFCVLLVVVAAEIAAGAWAYTNKDELKNLVKVSFQKTVEEEYGIIKSRTITVDTIQQEVYAPNEQSKYASFLLDVEAAMKIAAEADNFLIMGDFSAHLGNDSEKWRGVVGRNGDPDLNPNGKKLLEFCYANALGRAYGRAQVHLLHCCGANGPMDWANSQFNNRKEKLDLSVSSVLQNFEIPASCCKGDKDDVLCKTGRIAQGTLPISSIIYQEGCVASVYKYLESYAPIIIGVVIAIILLEILGLILSLILCCAVRFVDRYKA